MRKIKILIIMCILIPLANLFSQEIITKKVLIINSYNKGFPWTDNIVKGIESVLISETNNIELTVEYMNTKSIHYTNEYKKVLYDFYTYKYSNNDFDIIIVSDDNAFSFVREFGSELFPNVPIVFCGLNNSDSPNIVEPNIYTGILKTLSHEAIIDIILKLHPETKKIKLIVDKTPSGNYRWNEIEPSFKEYKDIEFTRISDDYTISEIENILSQLDNNTIVIFFTLYRDKSGKYLSLKESVTRITKSSSRPVYTTHLLELPYGVVGGKVVGGFYHGEVVANIAMRIFSGEDVKNISFISESPAQYVFDYEQLKKWGIKISDIPKGSTILNKPDSIYMIYKKIIWSVIILIVILTAIICTLQILNIRNKKIEEDLNNSKKLLDSTQAIAKVGGWELDIKTNNLFWTAETYNIYETSPDEFNPTVDAGLEYYLPESQIIISNALKAAINEGKNYDLELEIHTTKGNKIQVRTTCNVTIENGKVIKLNGIIQDITEQKRLTLEIGNLAKFPSQNPNPVLRITHKGQVLYANNSAEEIINFWETKIGKEVPIKWKKIIKKINHREKVLIMKETIFDKKFLFSVMPIKDEDYVNIYATNVTEQHLAEKSLKKFKTAIEKSEVTIIITNTQGQIEYANPYFTELTGYSIDEVLGKNPSILKSNIHTNSFYNEMWDTINSGNTWKGEICNKKKNGDIYWEKAIISPIKDNNKIITNYVAIKTDISADKKKEEQLRQFQKMEAIGQLAGGVAHDFNNMLTGIMGCAEIISIKVATDHELSQFANLIMDSSMQAAELTKKLLSFSRKGESVYKVFDIHESITKTCIILERSIDKSILIKSNLNADISLINGDVSLIENSLLNLGINARDVMPKGGELTFTTRNVNFTDLNKSPDKSISNGEYIEIDVKDTGFGMSKEVQNRLFEPFFTTKTIGKGTGLGLSIVYNTIKENNGFINVYSEMDYGSIFKIFLPVETDKQIDKQDEESKLLLGSGTILIADDENIVRLVSSQMLHELGYNVLLAQNGEECINIYKEKGSTIDMVILDMIMPKMNGRDVFNILKALNPNVKVLVCSGFSQDISIQKLLKDGVSGFLQKPFKKLELSIKVNEILSLKK